MKKIIYLAGIFLLFTACKNDDGAGMANLEYEGGNPFSISSETVTARPDDPSVGERTSPTV
jgi:hypothetical protein